MLTNGEFVGVDDNLHKINSFFYETGSRSNDVIVQRPFSNEWIRMMMKKFFKEMKLLVTVLDVTP